MKITNEFTVDIPIAQAWAILTDLEGVAPCLPGAQLTGVDGDVHQGTVKVKVGPVVSEFAGTARFVEKDEERYRGVIEAKGRDRRSAANASALVTAELRPDGQRTVVNVDTDLKISGRLAQFGSGMIKEVSGKLLAQFVANLEARLAAEETGDPHAATAPDASEPAPAVAATPDRATSAATGPDASTALPRTLAADADATPSGTTVAGTPVAVSAPTGRPDADADAEPETLDLLDIAGGAVVKRLVPVLVGIVVVGGMIAWWVARR
ncbi:MULTISPECIES: SRPBCC family protein [Micromonospora]|uniref:SRPBCC family protein n=1 Tax=Micromonospora TaxID=1873 RepID=UPI0003EEBE34|nr:MULTISPECIES: SRPBCC family protein [Micromonospora]EWM64917.1 carbon monoxide dehydrogenase G protein [Micromonospora sp. M42]MBC8989843.1 SRPBCC family protein [Micromonospora chalcea]MCK1804710.1 SRPBCC family protein [Micromonospora sp. R42106]MCK1830182.1 SRPBCC family protein [Micromonospora sp. R42003]MCK1841815.1 SRPBCC family protein [Micromonospora sp. R42004]